MEVIHQNENITHAVLGRGQTIEFKASTSSQIIFLLSTGLYKYPRLAAVREIICNAWDAHIVSGIRDKPVQITITREGELCIRDYGTGIPHDLIGPIYCTAGDSTKKESEDETGGFGLGSKAPFAYADHFKVTSHNGGIKTMYAMALSDSTKQGEPSAKVLYQTETEETGIEVRMQLKDGDISGFMALIRRVCYYGDINATLNGDKLMVCGMDESGSDTSFVHNHFAGDLMVGHNIFVRYGAVIYPLEHNDEYHSELRTFQQTVKHQYGGLNGGYTILRAPANSVSMVPSREALLYNPRTVGTIKQLLIDGLATLDEAKRENPKDTIRKMIRAYMMEAKYPGQLLRATLRDWPSLHHGFRPTDLLDKSGNAHTIQQMAMFHTIHNPEVVLRRKDVRRWYQELLWNMSTKFGTMNLAFAKKLMSPTRAIPHKTLIRDYITRPLIRGAQRAGMGAKELNRRLSFHESTVTEYLGQWKKNRQWVKSTQDGGMLDAVPKEQKAMISLLRPHLIVGLDIKADFKSAVSYAMTSFDGECYGAYVLSLDKKSTPEQIRTMCVEMSKMGFVVRDMAPHQRALAEDRAEIARERRASYLARYPKDTETGKPLKPTRLKNMLPSLASCETAGGFDRDKWFHAGAAQIEDPKIILVQTVNPKLCRAQLLHLNTDVSALIFKKYKSRVGVTNRVDVATRFYKDGAKSLQRTLIEDAIAEIDSNPKYKKAGLENAWIQKNTLNNRWRVAQMFSNFLSNSHFRKKLGLTVLNQEEQEWLLLFRNMYDFWSCYGEGNLTLKAKFADLFEHVVPSDVHPVAIRLISAKTGNDNLASNCDSSVFFNMDRHNPVASEKFVDFLFTAFNIEGDVP